MDGLRRHDFLAGAIAAAASLTATASLNAAASLGVTPSTSVDRMRRVRFGVNYVPSRSWWYAWGDWHADSIRRDLEDVAGLGVDHVRIQLLWPEFQPNISYVSEEKLDRLAAMLDIADGYGLDVEVTVLDGQLSGFLFIPSWLVDDQTGKVRDFISSPALIEAQQFLFETLGRRIGGHRRFMGFDIANEIHWAAIPLGISVTPAQGDAWMRALLETCERVAPGKMHVNGVDKYPLEDDEEHVFSRTALATLGAATVTHPWEGFGAVPGGLFARFGPTSVEATHFTEFLIQYLHAFARDLRRRVWIEEFGCSSRWVPAERIPDWAEATIRNAASCDRLYGMTWWCSHDPSRRFRGMNALEYDLGLFTNDRRRKPTGARLQKLIAGFAADPPMVVARPSAMVIGDGAGANGVFARYVRFVREGVRPQIVLASRANDRAYLNSRTIHELL